MDYKGLNEKWEGEWYRKKKDVARKIIREGREAFGEGLVMSSSFGDYSAVTLHLVNGLIPGIPVLNIKLEGETRGTEKHREKLCGRLNLNLIMYEEENYGGMSKKDIFEKALEDMGVGGLISGVRREETEQREDFRFGMVDEDNGVYRIHPTLVWEEGDLKKYIQEYDLPMNLNHRDMYKENGEGNECQIHIFKEGSGI